MVAMLDYPALEGPLERAGSPKSLSHGLGGCTLANAARLRLGLDDLLRDGWAWSIGVLWWYPGSPTEKYSLYVKTQVTSR